MKRFIKRPIRRLKNIVHLFGAVLSNIRFGFPSKKITVIGVTGTDGKTTTCHLIHHILKTADKNVSLSTSVYAEIGDDIEDTGLHITTQSHKDVQRNLRKAVNLGSEYFVLETTSHGLDQYRVWGVEYDIGVVTNVTKEHLDYHGTFEHYIRTKAKLPLRAKKALLNMDGASFKKLADILNKAGKKFKTYSINNSDADYTWKKKIKTALKEDFNKENIMAAFACCKELGLSEKDIVAGIQSFELPKGRFDTVYKGRFNVVVDFAHTANSIQRLLKSIKDERDGRIIHVFGAAGERDFEKRPVMGRASGEYADMVVITEEDYRTEDFDEITKAVSTGLFEKGFSYFESHMFATKKSDEKRFTIVRNRQNAIDLAVETAKQGDTVVITGKGHEQSLARGKKEYPWDEYKAVEKALENRKKS